MRLRIQKTHSGYSVQLVKPNKDSITVYATTNFENAYLIARDFKSFLGIRKKIHCKGFDVRDYPLLTQLTNRE